MHANTQVGSLDMRRGNPAEVRPSDFDVWDRPYNVTAAVPAISVGATDDFVKLRKIHVLAEVFAHRADISVVLVGRDLIAATRALPKIANEGVSIDAIARADVMADEQLSFGVDGQPDHRASPFLGIAFIQVRLPRVDVAPHLIQLDKARRDILYFGVRYLASFFRGREHQGKDRVFVKPRKAGDRAHAHALKHELKYLRRSLGIGVVGAQLRSRSGERCFTRLAAPALNAALAVVSELSARSVRAIDAGHDFSPLDCCAEKSHNELGSGSWLTPRFGLAPQPVSAGSGALIVKGYGLRWYNGNIHRGALSSESDLNRDGHRSILSESPVPAGLSHLTPKSLFRRRNVKLHRRFEGRLGSAYCRPPSRFKLGRHNPISQRITTENPSLPSISPVRISDGFQFSGLRHAVHRRMDGCHVILVGLEIEAHFGKQIAHNPWREDAARSIQFIARHNCSHRICQSERFVRRFIGKQRSQSLNSPKQVRFFLGEPLLFGFDLRHSKASLVDCRHIFVRCHALKINKEINFVKEKR